MKETAEDFMRREVEPRIRDIEEKKPGVMRAVLEKAGEVGLLGHDVPEEYGGLGGDKTSSSLIFESASRLGSFAVSYGAHVGIGTMPLVLFGTAEQKRRYLPSLATGERIAAYALTEPGSGSDALGAKTRAVLSADGKSWKLTGTKQYITNAGFADLFTVFAKVDGEKFTAFLIERGAPGLTIGPEEHKLGIRGSSTCPLFLEDCTIPVDSVLGTIGAGHKIAFNILNIGRWKLGVGAVGGAKYCLEIGVKYARERKQFGKPIAEFDLIRKKIGEIATQTYVAESMAFRTAGLLDARSRAIDPADPAARQEADRRHRGALDRGVDHQGLRLGDAALHRRRDAADLRRRRLHRGLPDRARQPRRAHQPHLRGHQRDQPPAGARHAAQARAVGAAGPDGAGRPGAAGAGRPDEDRPPRRRRPARASSGRCATSPSGRSPTARRWACRSTCRRSPTSRSCWACWPTA